MKKQFLFLLTFFFVSQFVLAVGGATDIALDTFTKCDEQYYSVIKLKIKRPEAIPFTINAKGGKVEFSTGNLQYRASNNTFRFATRQWETVGNGVTTSAVMWDSTVVKPKLDASGNQEYDGEGKPVMKIDTYRVRSNNNFIGPKYRGWIDLFGWGTSGYNPNAANEPDRDDIHNTCTKPYSVSTSVVNESYNKYGYGPSYNRAGIYRHIDTTDAVSRKYDWGYFNDIYCKWVGYDTTHVGTTGLDSIVFDSTMFNARVWRALTDTEWTYMLFTRKVENKKASAWAYVQLQPADGTEFPGNGGADPLQLNSVITGMLIFPDDFELSEAFKVGYERRDADSIAYGGTGRARKLSYKNFIALEKLGVIFIPTMHRRSGQETRDYANDATGNIGYWSTTNNKQSDANAPKFSCGVTVNPKTFVAPTIMKTQWERYLGLHVRLVRDLDVNRDKPVSAYQ